MSQRRTLTYPSADGRHTIRAVEWTPEGAPRGVIQIVHGIAGVVIAVSHQGRLVHSRSRGSRIGLRYGIDLGRGLRRCGLGRLRLGRMGTHGVVGAHELLGAVRRRWRD